MTIETVSKDVHPRAATLAGMTEMGVTKTVTTEGPRCERVLGHLPGRQPGPTLIVVAGMHGNEPAGVHGAQRVLAALADRRDDLNGTFIALAGNLTALRAKARYVEADLNRLWTRARVDAIRAGAAPACVEEAELRDLDLELRAAVTNATGPLYILDLHTTSAPGPPFVVLNDTLPNRGFALSFPVPVVLGLEEELEGTLLAYLARSLDIVSAGFESGQHEEHRAVGRAASAIWLALEHSGVIHSEDWPEVEAAHKDLETAGSSLPAMVDVHHREHIEAADEFRMAPGFVGFQTIRAGQVLATNRLGPVVSPQDGLILMPLYQGQGADGFFLVREVRPIWLRLSAALRRFHLEGYLHWLPGIRRHPDMADAVIIDRKVARLLAVEFFHLLGFSRVGDPSARYLVMRRRRFDRAR